MDEQAASRRHGGGWPILILIAALGIAARLALPMLGHNFDVDSYRIVADIMAAGGNVYAETSRYNYGPVWFTILHALDLLPSPAGFDPTKALHIKIAGFLTLVDLGLLAILVRRWSVAVGALFFLNPVSVLITGYHSQFDNLPVLIAFAAVVLFDGTRSPAGRAATLAGLGLSLMAKHLLFLFPMWLAMRQASWTARFFTLAIPYGIFLAGFLFYLPAGFEGIRDNVFLYRSFDNAPLWRALLPDALLDHIPLIVLFAGAMLALGWVIRDRSTFAMLRIYFIALVVFASAIANQYLAIPAASIAAGWNLFYAAFSASGTMVLLLDENGLALGLVPWGFRATEFGYMLCALLLGIGLLVDVTGKSLRELAEAARTRLQRKG